MQRTIDTTANNVNSTTVIVNKVQLIDDNTYDNLTSDALEHLCNNKLIITGAKAIPDDIAMGVDVDSMKMSDHVKFDASQTSDLAETMAKHMLKGIPLT